MCWFFFLFFLRTTQSRARRKFPLVSLVRRAGSSGNWMERRDFFFFNGEQSPFWKTRNCSHLNEVKPSPFWVPRRKSSKTLKKKVVVTFFPLIIGETTARLLVLLPPEGWPEKRWVEWQRWSKIQLIESLLLRKRKRLCGLVSQQPKRHTQPFVQCRTVTNSTIQPSRKKSGRWNPKRKTGHFDPFQSLSLCICVCVSESPGQKNIKGMGFEGEKKYTLLHFPTTELLLLLLLAQLKKIHHLLLLEQIMCYSSVMSSTGI